MSAINMETSSHGLVTQISHFYPDQDSPKSVDFGVVPLNRGCFDLSSKEKQMLWFRRFAAIILISAGAALVILPFPETMSGEKSREYVSLEIETAPYTEESARAEFGDSLIQLEYEELENYPEVLDVVLRLMGETDVWCVLEAQWNAFLQDRGVVDPEGLVYAFRDDLHRISNIEAEKGEDGDLVCFKATLLGAFDNREYNPMTWLDAEDLEDYPELSAQLERMAEGPVPVEERADIDVGQWRRFHRRELDDFEFRPPFVVFDRLFFGSVDTELVPWSLDTPWLRTAAGAVGGVALLCGLVLMIRAYRGAGKRRGIPISPGWLAVFADSISLTAAVIFVGVMIDTLWVGLLRQPSLVGLHPDFLATTPITGLHFVSVTVFPIALPLFTLFVVSLTGQRIEVGAEGVTSHGAIGSRSISWQDLEKISLREQRNPFAFTVVDFRKLQTVLDLEGEGHTVTINEPSSRKRKRQVIDALRRFVPEEKNDLVRDIEGVW